jgi:predicted DsbA family dithiol-disulfide isomerase
MSRLLLLLIIILSSCSNSDIKNNEEVVFVIDNVRFYKNELDSLVEDEVLIIKKKGIQKLINNYLLNKEAKKLNISIDSLLKLKNILNNNNNFVFNNNFNELPDSEKMIFYQKSIEIKERESAYLDSLYLINNIDIYLNLKETDIFNGENIHSFSFKNIESKNKIYIISDPFCTSCLKITEQFDKLMKEYKNIDFQYIYFSQPINDIAIALFFANQHGKFYPFYKKIINDIKNNIEPDVFKIANKLNMNLVDFRENLSKKTGIKELMINNKILQDNNIYSTPTFIVNNKIYSGTDIIYYLRNIIKNEFE